MEHEVDFFKMGRFDADVVISHSRKRFNLKADVASRLMEHFAIIAAREDGEDSAGRRALKLQTPEEVVKRACEIAEQLVDEFDRRGWIIDIPAYQDLPKLPV